MNDFQVGIALILVGVVIPLIALIWLLSVINRRKKRAYSQQVKTRLEYVMMPRPFDERNKGNV